MGVYPVLLFDLRLQVVSGKTGHHPADTVRGKKLPLPGITQVKPHKEISKEVLVRILLQRIHGQGKHLADPLQLLRLVSLCNADIFLFTLLPV